MGGWSDRNLQVSMSPVYIPHEGEGGRGVGDILPLNISNSDISKNSLVSTNIHVVWTNFMALFIPIALRKAKIVCNVGLSECSRVKLLIIQTTDIAK